MGRGELESDEGHAFKTSRTSQAKRLELGEQRFRLSRILPQQE